MKKRLLILSIILFIFPILASAATISRNDVPSSTYIIGKYMFTRETNSSTGYKGELTTKMIMLASRTINSNNLSDMTIYYKRATGTWIDALTGDLLTVPNSFEIEVTNLSGTSTISTPILETTSYSNNDISSSTYIIGKYMFTRETNSSMGYKGELTTKMIMLASRTINSNNLSDMTIYYKRATGTWIDALTGDSLTLSNSFDIGNVNLTDLNVNQVAPVVNYIEGGTTLKTTSQSIVLKCDSTTTAYYFGTTEPKSSSSISTTTDLALLKGTGLSKTISSAGTYWLGCKNKAGKYATKNITIVNYKVNNLLEIVDGTAGTYTSANYKSENDYSYIVKIGTKLTLETIYTAPVGSNFKGYSTNYGTSVSSINTSAPTVSSGTTYYMWFNRNTYTIIYNSSGGTGSMANQTMKYGKTYKLNTNSFAKEGYTFAGWNGVIYSSTEQQGGDDRFLAYVDLAPYFDIYGLNATYHIEFEMKSSGSAGDIQAYGYQCTAGYAKYCINSAHSYGATTSYKQFGFDFTISNNINPKQNVTQLAFYGASADIKPVVKNVVVTLVPNSNGSAYADGASVSNLTATNGANIRLYAIWRKPSTKVRIATFNVEGFQLARPATIADVIKNNNIDIVGIQEGKDVINGDYYACQKVANNLGYNMAAYTIPGQINVVLSNPAYSVINREQNNEIFLPKNCTEPYDESDRRLAKAIININGVDISVYSGHFGLGDCNEVHLQSAVEQIKNDPNPSIVLADYNTVPIDRFNKYFINNGFIIAAHETGYNNMWTDYSWYNGESYCDSVIIYPKGHIKAIKSETVSTYKTYSDHNMVIATLEIN